MGITSRTPKLRQQGTLTQQKRVPSQNLLPALLITPTPSPSPTSPPRHSPSHLHPRYKATQDHCINTPNMVLNETSEKKPSPATFSWRSPFFRSYSSPSTSITSIATKAKSYNGTDADSENSLATASMASSMPPPWKQAPPDAPYRPAHYSVGDPTTHKGIDDNHPGRERSQSPRPFDNLRTRAGQLFSTGSVSDPSGPIGMSREANGKHVQAWIEHPDGTKVESRLDFMLANHVRIST